MQYRRLGKSGLKLSVLSYGSWVTFKSQIDVSNAESMMARAYEAGVNFFDNAEAYAAGESEIIMGKALQKLAWPRDTYTVSSKVFWGGNLPNQKGLSHKHVFEACHAALKRLQVDYLDLYFCHRPDSETPIEETVRAMDILIKQGKVLYWGTSEWSAQEIMEAHSVARQYGLTPPTMEQPQYNMFHRDRFEAEYRRLYSEIGLGTTIWSPLASGVLTGKYLEGIPEDSRMNMENLGFLKRAFESAEGQVRQAKTRELFALAQDLGTSLTKLALAWCVMNPNVSTVILGASKLTQLEENLAAMDVIDVLTPDVMAQIENILDNRPPPAPSF